MNKLLTVIFAIGMIAAVSNTASGTTISVNSANNAGIEYTSGIDVEFEAGTYEFFVENGAWSTDFGDSWMWNVDIYRLNTETYDRLGTFTPYGSINEARNANLSATPVTLTLSEGEHLRFYNYDSDGKKFNNDGTVFIGVDFTPTVVPEPVSSILFVTGGAFMAGRRYLTRKG